MNPRVAEADGSDGGGASSESPAEVVTFSKKGKGGVGKGAPTKGGKFAKLVGGAKAAPVTAGDQQKKKAGKDMSVTEIEWEKKAINASIAGQVLRVPTSRGWIRELMLSINCYGLINCLPHHERLKQQLIRAPNVPPAGMCATWRQKRLRW